MSAEDLTKVPAEDKVDVRFDARHPDRGPQVLGKRQRAAHGRLGLGRRGRCHEGHEQLDKGVGLVEAAVDLVDNVPQMTGSARTRNRRACAVGGLDVLEGSGNERVHTCPHNIALALGLSQSGNAFSV